MSLELILLIGFFIVFVVWEAIQNGKLKRLDGTLATQANSLAKLQESLGRRGKDTEGEPDEQKDVIDIPGRRGTGSG